MCKLTIFNSKLQLFVRSLRRGSNQLIIRFNATYLLFCFGILLVPTLLFAQDPVSINYNSENGLPSNTVYYTMQDSRGYIWFATDKGVVKFDGITFRTYTTSDGITDNECYDIFEDSQHRIWFSTYNGTPYYFKNDKFYTKNNTVLLQETNFDGPGLKVLEDKNGNLFYLTHRTVYQILNSTIRVVNRSAVYYSSLFLDEENNCYALGSYDRKTLAIPLGPKKNRSR